MKLLLSAFLASSFLTTTADAGAFRNCSEERIVNVVRRIALDNLPSGLEMFNCNRTNVSVSLDKDIDVYTFFAVDEGKPFPPRRPVMNYDFGSSKFGRHPDDLGYIGRRVDCLGRSIAYAVGTSPIEALQNFLLKKPTRTACLLAQKAVVIIDPVEYRGDVVWPKPVMIPG